MYYYSFYSCIISCCHQLIFFWGESPRFIFLYFCASLTLWISVDRLIWWCVPHRFGRLYSACPRVWTAITANDGQLFTHEDDGASPHPPHGQKLRHPNQKKKMWCNESHVVGAPKKKIKEKEATTTVRPYVHAVRLGKSPQTNSHKRHRILWGIPSISPPSIHPSNRREGTRSAL